MEKTNTKHEQVLSQETLEFWGFSVPSRDKISQETLMTETLLDAIARNISHDLHEGYIVPNQKFPLELLDEVLQNLKVSIRTTCNQQGFLIKEK